MKDEVGKQYGKLKVVEFSHVNKYGIAYFMCECDCGNKLVVRGSGLRSGHTRSCGCIKLDTYGTAR